MRSDLAESLRAATDAPGIDLAAAALVIARIEYPKLEPGPWLARLDEMGESARFAVSQGAERTGGHTTLASVRALNHFLFDELGFAGNQRQFHDPRNSCLNEVIERRIGIPITLSIVYVEVARRAGLQMEGINFPGHFLVRCPDRAGARSPGIIIDVYHGGAILSENRCRVLLQQHAGDEMAYSAALLAPATRVQIVVRMLLNLKRLYVHMRSFPQAREVAELLVTMMPSALSELRDRGLLAYHLNDVSGALRDLQTYLKLASMSDLDREERKEHEQIWEHVKTLRRRVAALN